MSLPRPHYIIVAMNISYNWLKEYLDFDLTPQQVSEALTSIGLEVGGLEEVESIRGGLRGLVVGKVLTCVDHPDSDHLHITTVDLGDGQPTQIVCGAPNVAAGQTVIVATVGTTLYDGDKEFKIKKSKIRGVESFGMICAEDEISVGNSHDGIIVITDRQVAAGTPAAQYYGLTSDYVIEVDLTPNRVDAASHYGVARDLSAWLACHAEPRTPRLPAVDGFSIDNPDGAISVTVTNTEACPRYSGVTIRGVRVAESPKWLRDHLTAIGQRPINNIVDITNYILLGIGQPLHCFDLNHIDGGRIIVGTCPEGTPFTTLDGVERKLDSRDLMINSASAPMCLAGVFGGINSGVTETTTDIFIESAYFNPTWIRKAARRHGLQTDASFRYERGTDPNITIYALKLAALMVRQLAGGQICGHIVDIYPDPIRPAEVLYDYERANRLIGKDLPRELVDKILTSLEIRISGETDSTALLTIPTYRVDVTRPCDVTEDVLRIYGYNNVEIDTTLKSSLSFKTATDAGDDLRRLISEQLTARGFNEILNNSLTAESYYTGSSTYPADGCVRLLNPLSNELNVMRRTLLFGGLEVLNHNINRRAADLMLYEFGNVYGYNPKAVTADSQPLAPYSEGSRLAVWMTGDIRRASWNSAATEVSVYDLKAIVADILSRLGVTQREISVTAAGADDIYAAALTVATRQGRQLGRLGIIAAPLLKRFDIKQQVLFAEFDWRALVSISARHKVTYTELPKTMPVRRDLALLVDNAVTMADITAVVRECERRLLRDVTLFDVYEGDKLPAGKKSYAIAITLRDDERTLQDKQIDATMNKIISNLTKRLGAELR